MEILVVNILGRSSPRSKPLNHCHPLIPYNHDMKWESDLLALH